MSNGSAKQLFQQAGQLFQAKRYPDALRILDRLAQEAPGNTEVLYARAMCLGALGKAAEAVEICEMLANVYGDARGAQLRARLTQPRRAPTPPGAQAPAARPAAAAKPAPAAQQAGAPAKKSSRNLVLVAVLVVLVAGAGGAYYYLNSMQAEEAPAGAARTAPVPGPAQPQAVNGIFGDPNGVKLATTNETGGVLDVWLGDVGATIAPLASLQAGEKGTIGIAAGRHKIRARADWGNVLFHTAIQDIDVSGPEQVVFFREVNPMGIPEVKWRVQ